MDKNNLKYDDGSVSAAILQRLDKRDHDMQMAGYATGRLRLCFNSSCLALGQNLEEENEQQQTMRMIRQAFGMSLEDRIEKLSHNLTLAETASYESLIEAQEVRDFAAQALKALQANAHVHPDGRRVYLSKDGAYAIDENMDLLSQEDMTKIEWQRDKPTAQQFVYRRNDLMRADQNLQATATFNNELEEAQRAFQNGEITTHEQADKIDNLFNTMPDSVRKHYEKNGGAALNEAMDIPAKSLPSAQSFFQNFDAR